MSNLVCDNCGHDYGEYTEELDKLKRCTYCGSDKLNRYLYLSDRIGFYENIKGKSNKLPGKKKPAVEFQAGEERSVSLNKWVNKSRVIDRENDRYYEEVVDPDTGNVLHKCEEPLTKHFGHGSAKKKEMKTKMLTIIMAGGRGIRISELFPDIPKPLIPINGIPVLEREIISLRDQGFTDFILTVSYLHEKIEEYFGDGSRLGVKIEYFVEETPLGNAGALFKLRDRIGDSPFLLLNADAVFDVDFNRMVAFHKAHGGLVTLFTHPNSHPYDSGLIIADEENRVEAWLAKEDERPLYYKNRVNAGLHVISPKVLEMSGIDADEIGKEIDGKIKKADLDRQILKPLAGTGTMFCYDSPEYVKDMGTPERFNSVVEDYKSGVVSGKNLSNKQKAIFLDRDGTINKYVGFLRDIDDFELIDGVAEAIKLINKSGYLAIVITNQPVIARGEVTVPQLEEIHKKLETELGYSGAYIDALYYCPHHPHKGYEGEVPELKIDCDCRKPKPGLILRAAEKYNIELESSYMIGDSDSDVQAGEAAGCQIIKIDTDQSILDVIKGIEKSREVITVEQICPNCFKPIEKYGVYKCPHCDARLSWRVTPRVKREFEK